MSAAREEILGRIRVALADVPASERADDVPAAREYRRQSEQPCASGLLDLLEQRLRDYHAYPQQLTPGDVATAAARVCREHGLRTLALPASIPPEWRPDGVELIEDAGMTAAELDRTDAALTGCAAAIAETGTIVLDGRGASGRRALTLIPDHHICVIEAAQVVALVPEAIARLAPAVIEDRAPVTLISGPSATSDIELSRVEGVHGPRNLHVLLVRG